MDDDAYTPAPEAEDKGNLHIHPTVELISLSVPQEERYSPRRARPCRILPRLHNPTHRHPKHTRHHCNNLLLGTPERREILGLLKGSPWRVCEWDTHV